MMRQFISISLALLFVFLTVVEHYSYRVWDNAQVRHQEIQSKIVATQFWNFRTEQLLRRIARDSVTDPGLMEGLKRCGIIFQTAGSKSRDEKTAKSVTQPQTPPSADEANPKPPPARGNLHTE